MLREANRRKGFFEAEEYRAVLDRLPEELKPVIQTAYVTGWRITSEILTRQKHHVNLEAGWLRLEPGETKNGEGRNFPLTPDLRDVLQWQLEQTRGLKQATGRIIPWLFHRDGNPIQDLGFRSGRRPAIKPECRDVFRDFRRTACVIWNALAFPGQRRWLWWAIVRKIYRRYAIADETMLKEGAIKLAAFHASEKNGARRSSR